MSIVYLFTFILLAAASNDSETFNIVKTIKHNQQKYYKMIVLVDKLVTPQEVQQNPGNRMRGHTDQRNSN